MCLSNRSSAGAMGDPAPRRLRVCLDVQRKDGTVAGRDIPFHVLYWHSDAVEQGEEFGQREKDPDFWNLDAAGFTGVSKVLQFFCE